MRRRAFALVGLLALTGCAAPSFADGLTHGECDATVNNVTVCRSTAKPIPTVTVTVTPAPTATPTPTPTPTPTTPPAGPVPTGVTGSWALAFDDEFDGTALDTSKWSPNWFSEGGVMNNAGTYARNVTVANGELSLALVSASDGALIHTGYAAGRYQLPVGSVTEARVLFPGGATCNNWPAWWASGPSWPAAGEHDIAEVLSGNLTAGNYHAPAGANNGPAPAGTWCGSYHVYTLYRGATSAQVYWDGVLERSYSTSDNGAGEELILNHGSSGTVTPGVLKVDYVRAWKPAP